VLKKPIKHRRERVNSISWDMAQMVEYLPSKHKAGSSKPTIIEKGKFYTMNC
jgi:hypothetical protein